MYLVCDICEDSHFKTALYLGKRMGTGYYAPVRVATDVEYNTFFDRHEFCGGTLDHFSIRYELPANSI